jgi:CheY-like chemotaxis protein
VLFCGLRAPASRVSTDPFIFHLEHPILPTHLVVRGPPASWVGRGGGLIIAMPTSLLDSLAEPSVLPGRRVPRVVLIEDDPYVGAAVTLYLGKKGFAVEHFTAAAEAQRRLSAEVCDLVITDIFMPESDGLEVIQWLRAELPHLRVIAISGSDYQGNSYLKAARLLGASRVLPKPFELSRLVELIEELLPRGD